MNSNKKTVAFLGDSITQGIYTDIVKKRQIEMKQKYCDFAAEILNFDVKNYGISGTCISPNTVQLPDKAFIKRYNDMDDNADVVCILGGTNDYGTDVPVGTPDDTDEATFCGALNILCDGLSKKYEGKQVVFITPFYRVCTKNNAGHTLQQYRDAITSIAQTKFGFYVIDGLQLGPNDKTENLELLLFDGLHPNPPAHEIIGERLAKKFVELSII